jgi:adenine-specific DNA-methyltransferase
MNARAKRDATIEQVEAARLAAQGDLDKSVPNTERNRRGQFATPPVLAEAMVRLARDLFPEIKRVRFLDPALGTGVFYSALLKVCGARNVASAVGFEIDPRLVTVANRLWGPFDLQVVAKDFTRAEPPSPDDEKPNLIVCNPPYVRHHHLDQETKTRLRTRVVRNGGPLLNGLTGLYGYFLFLAHRWLAKDGGAVWIVPAELLDVNYGEALKRYLCTQVTLLRVHRFDPSDVQFGDALITSLVIALRNTPPRRDRRVRLTHGGNLFAPTFERYVEVRDLDPALKWGLLFSVRPSPVRLSTRETLGDLFEVKRGIATGANAFFVLDVTAASQLGLPAQFLRPVLPSPRLIASEVIEGDEGGFPLDLPKLVLLDCSLPRAEISRRFPKLDHYLESGEERGISRRYLQTSRTPWYRQEDRPPAPILATYMARKKHDGRSLRFIRNRSGATALNVYLLLYPKSELASAIQRDPGLLDHIFHRLQSIKDIEHVGRVYGGGLKKVEPRELASLELPSGLIAAIRDLGQSTKLAQEKLPLVMDR